MSMHPLHSKSGLVRSFIVVVFGILFLSFIGFDLRGKVNDFQTNNAEDITTVKQVLFNTIIPRTKESFDELKEFANENNLTIEKAQEVLNLFKKYKDQVNFEEYGIDVPNFGESTTE